MEGLVEMSVGERERLRLVQAIREGRLTQVAAADRLGLSVRQVKRLCRAYRRHGAAGLVSRKRGRRSNRRIAARERRRVIDLVRRRYPDFGPTLAHEYLAEQHGFAHSVETLRQWMIAAGLWQATSVRHRPIHRLRPRREALGELIQIDGSPHAWFEARGPRCCLIVFVDDATGLLQYAQFVPVECTRAYLQALEAYVRCHGRPLALYSDRHTIFTKHNPEDAVPTQFERAARALGIAPILARSPQAKGRVERAFQTLQDRLVKALRLAGLHGLEDANAWLPGFLAHHNARFARPPAHPVDAHRPTDLATQTLHWICEEQHQRTLSRSLSFQYRSQRYVIDTGGAMAYALRQAHVTVCDPGNDQPVVVLHKGKSLPYRKCDTPPPTAERIADDKQISSFLDQLVRAQRHSRASSHKPAPDHPWLGKYRRPSPATIAPS
jgi:transposase